MPRSSVACSLCPPRSSQISRGGPVKQPMDRSSCSLARKRLNIHPLIPLTRQGQIATFSPLLLRSSFLEGAAMSATASAVDLPHVGGLPARIKVLYITTTLHTGDWLAEALAADSASQILLEEVVGEAAALARLRGEVFDAVLLSHEPGELDALDLVEGLRAGGNEDPMIVLGSAPPQQVDALCYETGADDYCCIGETTVRGLLWKFGRAIQQHQLLRENRKLVGRTALGEARR